MRRFKFLLCIIPLLFIILTACQSRCKVTFVLDNDGKSVAVEVDKGTVLWIPKSTDSTLSFAGWYLDSEYKERYTKGNIDEDVILYAAWVEGNGEEIELTLRDGSCEPYKHTVISGSTYGQIEKPVKDGYIFKGWSNEPEGEPFAPGAFVTESMELYPVWEVDTVAFVNRISVKVLPATVGVSAVRHDSHMFRPSNISGGSGVIFKESSSHYYILTNHHVVEQRDNYDVIEYTVSDCYGEVYEASLEVSSYEYDLAVLKIRKGEKKLGVLSLADDPAVGETVSAVGYPKGVVNAVTVGKVAGYSKVDITGTKSGITFDTGIHLAPTDHGSSGGAVVNGDLELVGINYASSVDTEKGTSYGVFVQASKVAEFLKKYN